MIFIKNVLIRVSTPTYAIKVKRILRSAGINGEIVKLNTEIGKGCTHAIRINRNSLYRAAAILRENNITYSVFEE